MKPGPAAILAHMQFKLAKAAAECHVLFGGELLITKKYHFVFMPQIDDVVEGGVVEVLRQIDAQNFRAKRGTGGANVK